METLGTCISWEYFLWHLWVLVITRDNARFNFWEMVALEGAGGRSEKGVLLKSNKSKQGGGGFKFWSFCENVIIEWPCVLVWLVEKSLDRLISRRSHSHWRKCCNVELKAALQKFIGLIIVVGNIFLSINNSDTITVLISKVLCCIQLQWLMCLRLYC